ncbi:cell wall-associated NlpC family hydrolase [Pseudomonas duriflava]|uniref:Cell wall-associated NlpC family hydrolase n=1 Tax=Pseudomonas duriflava TaxID=459528 RepID=A0A562QAI3_9PSED|nr:C40 family peptidase [Pseudomonas duriflava]TWI53767.1 cell wall-associated NlpC family hydrolase [Pseudomonas duriflava]
MSALMRFALIGVVALLTACVGNSPPVVSPQPAAPMSVPNTYSQAADDVLFRALGLVGTPYRYGGNTPAGGFDCSGLINFVYQDVMGIRLPRTTHDMINLNTPSVARASLQPGDLVFFATAGGKQVSHAGIYVGEGRFVHAPSSGGTVRLDSLDSRYWQKAYLNAKRVLVTSNLASSAP